MPDAKNQDQQQGQGYQFCYSIKDSQLNRDVGKHNQQNKIREHEDISVKEYGFKFMCFFVIHMLHNFYIIF